MTRALFIGPNLAAGGAERQWSILLPGLRRLGIDARLIALDAGGPFADPIRRSGVPLEILSMRHQADIRSLAASRLLRRFAPDVVVTRGVSGLYVGHLVSRLRHAPHVYNEHRGIGLRLSRRRELMTSLISRRLDLVIAVAAELAGPWTDRSFPAERIVVIANGVEASTPLVSKLAIRAELGIPASAVVALLVATLRPEKRVEDFTCAVRRARETHPEIVGLIAGDGPDRAAAEATAGSGAGIRFLGHRDDVPSLLAAADVFVLASEYEAVPMAILEGMAAGLPILCTSVGSLPEVITHGQTGLLVPPRDPEAMAAALVELAADPALRDEMGNAAARTHRAHWGAQAMVDAYAEVLEGLPSKRALSRTL